LYRSEAVFNRFDTYQLWSDKEIDRRTEGRTDGRTEMRYEYRATVIKLTRDKAKRIRSAAPPGEQD